MAASSAIIPIIVAVIGVVGTIAPLYINNSVSTNPGIVIEAQPLESNVSGDIVHIGNVGNAPATNMSVILSSCWSGYSNMTSRFMLQPLTSDCKARIHSITNSYSTADVVLTPKNVSLESGSTQIVNKSIVRVIIPRLVQGPASFINLQVNPSLGDVFVTYDQGSTSLRLFDLAWEDAVPIWLENTGLFGPLGLFYLIFYLTFFILIGWYIGRLMDGRAVKRFLANITDNIMQVRGALRRDHTHKNDFPDVWNEMPANKRRKAMRDISDYLVVDDFYSELTNRNIYLSSDLDKKESGLSRANTLSKLNEALLTAAENVLNKVDWNKYR